MYSIDRGDRKSDEAETYFKILKEAADEYEKPIEPKPPFRYWNLVFLALDYNKNNGVNVKEIENEQAQVDEINKRIDETKYREWLDLLFAKLSVQEGIYNGKDRETNTGTRTFKQTHWNVTRRPEIQVLPPQPMIKTLQVLRNQGLQGLLLYLCF